MTRPELIDLAKAATARTLEVASENLGWSLPATCCHGVYSDELFGKTMSLEEAINTLWEDEKFPAIVDLAVRGTIEDEPLVVWLRSGHPKVDKLEETWNDGYGPFKPMGLLIPSEFPPKGRLTRAQMAEIGRGWFDLPNN